MGGQTTTRVRTIRLEFEPTRFHCALDDQGYEIHRPETWAYAESKRLFDLNLPGDWKAALRQLTRTRTEVDLVTFFNRMGYTLVRDGRFAPIYDKTLAWKLTDITPEISQRWFLYGDIVRIMLTKPKKAWVRSMAKMPVQIVLYFTEGFGSRMRHPLVIKQEGGLAAVAVGMTPLSTLILHVHYELLAGQEFGTCILSDCRAIFPIESAHGKQYCSERCSDTQKKRRYRQRKKQAEKAGKA